MRKDANQRTKDAFVKDLLTAVEENLSPEEVFDYDYLVDWCVEGNMVDDLLQYDSVVDRIRDTTDPEDIFDDGALIDYVAKGFTPSEVFSFSALEEWALANGFREDNGL